MDIQYIGEHLLPGQIGRISVIVAFVAAILSTISFYFATKENEDTLSWKRIARIAFRIHSLAVLGIISAMFFIIYNHYFEYQYVWQHSSTSLPLHYIISCFWEGQEGSFLLWTFWHVVLGNILIKKAKTWESSTMTIISLVQIFLSSMLLGVYFYGQKIGSSPFILIRQLPEYLNLPFVQQVDYLANPQFADGRGLNPLLQNYWMVIHPPILFLGFALTLPPFAFAIAALWQKRYKEWLKPCLPWAFTAVMVLGVGILLGGAWAYESLSFGGFWAWDPVENASLVPWLTLVGAAHLILIQKNKGDSLHATFLLTIGTFMLILYSTYLTRSGVLGDSSVHSFAGGLPGQLLVYMFAFLILSIVLFIVRYKEIPSNKKDDDLWSREFWVFIGTLVLLISSFQITFTTSIPVINKVFGTNMAPPIDALDHYNSWQTPFAIVIGLLIAVTQFFNYKKTDMAVFRKRIMFAFIMAILISVFFAVLLHITDPILLMMLFTSTFAITANFSYWRKVLKGRIKTAGASIAHIGFGMILLGTLLSNGTKETISINKEYIAKDFAMNENLLLELGDTLEMGEFMVSYEGSYDEGINKMYTVKYFNKDSEGKAGEELFTLTPFIQINKRMGNVREPSTKHFLHRDIYTHLTYASNLVEKTEEGYTGESSIELLKGDTAIYAGHFVILDSLSVDPNLSYIEGENRQIAVAAHITTVNVKGEKDSATPIYYLRNDMVNQIESKTKDGALKFAFTDIKVDDKGQIVLKAYSKQEEKEFIIMRAIIFPYINVLWLGIIIMMLGSGIAANTRFKQLRNSA